MKRLACCTFAVVLMAMARSASASPITTTYDFSFSFYQQPTGTAAGFVTISDNAGVYTLANWNVLVSGMVDSNGNPVAPVDFNPSQPNATGTYDNGDPLFNLLQQDPIELEWQTMYDCNNINQILLNGTFNNGNGFVADMMGGGVMTATPEPATWALLGGGMLVLLGLGWRQRKAGADARA